MAHKARGYATRQRRQTKVLPRAAPIGGLNNRDALASMPALDAYELDNWFPQQDGCVTRNGSEGHATGLGGDVETVAVYAGGGSPQLIGFANGSIFNATAAGAVGAAIVAGRTNNKVVTTMFSNAGAQFMVGVNGADTPFSYDGAAYAALVITGVTGGSDNTLAYVHSHNKRLYFANNGELGFYYLASEAIQGAAGYFDLSQIFRKGGYLMAIGSLTQDTGDGPDDFIFFISSEGEICIYRGSDPSAANDWAIVGTYTLGAPIGRKCLHKYGGDSLVMTTMGLLPVSILFKSSEPTTRDALSSKLGRALLAHLPYAATYGWHMVLHPTNTMLILNAPFDGSYYQYVMNTVTGAWCRFKGWEALSFADLDGDLYFGAAGGIILKADTGTDDGGEPIRCNAKSAYDYFNETELKHWLNARVMLEFNGSPPLSASFSVDYKETIPVYVGEVSGSGSSEWDDAEWDDAPWSSDTEVATKWMDINKLGFAGSLWLRAEVSTTTLKWFATEFLYTVGGVV